MTEKHQDAGVQAAIEVAERHRDRYRGKKRKTTLDAERGWYAALATVGTEIAAELRALPPTQPDTAALEEVLEEFERRTKAIPEGHEDATKGASSYNWRMACLREIRALAQAKEKAEALIQAD